MHSESGNKASKLGCASVYVVVYKNMKITWWLLSSSVRECEDDVSLWNMCHAVEAVLPLLTAREFLKKVGYGTMFLSSIVLLLLHW